MQEKDREEAWDIVVPKAPISQVVQVELSMAESVRDLLVVLDFTSDDWKREEAAGDS